jgi:hypothetical protein
MVNKKYSIWPIKMTSVLGLAVGLAMLGGYSGGSTTQMLDMNALIYPIIAIGIAAIIVFWFMHEVSQSYNP